MTEGLDIEFGASAPGLRSQISEVLASIHSIRDALEALRGLSQGVRDGVRDVFQDPPGDLERELREAAREADHLGDELGQADRKSQDLSSSLSGMVGGLGGVVAGIVGGLSLNAIMSWADGIAGGAEEINNLSQRLGINTTQIQGWRTVLETAGLSAESFGSTMTKLEMNLVKARDGTGAQANALRQMGIEARSAQDPNEVLLQIADRFQTMADGPEKVALAMQLMGRSGATLIPVLNQGREAIEEQIASAERYGVVMDESMIAQAAALDDALDENNLAMQGLSNTIFSEMAPTMIALVETFNEFVSVGVESYRTGGLVATIFDVMGATIRGFVVGVAVVGTTIYAIFEGINGFCWELDATFREIFESIRVSFEIGVAAAGVFGTALYDLMTFNWGQMASNAEAGMARIAAAAESAGARIAAAGAQSRQFMAESAGRIDAARSGLVGFAGRMSGGTPGYVGNIFGTSAPGGDLDDAPSFGGGGGGGGARRGGGGGGGAAKDNRVQQWTEELQRMQAASGEYFRDQTSAELEFWRSKQTQTRQGTDAWYDVQQRIYTLSRTQARQSYQEEIQDLGARIQRERDTHDVAAGLADQRLALVRRTYGEDSREYRSALREREQMTEQHQRELAQIEQRSRQQRLAMAEESARADTAIQSSAIQIQGQRLQYLESAGLVGRREAAAERARIAQLEFDNTVALENRMYQLKTDSLRSQLQIEGLRPQQIAQINMEIERLEASHNTRMRVLAQQQTQITTQANTAAANAVRNVWLDRLQPVSSALTGMVNGFLTGTQTIRGAVLQMGSQILQSVNKWIMDWVVAHVAGEQARTAATVAGDTARTASTTAAAATGMAASTTAATAQITTNAAVGASGALAAVSSIPVIGPFIAPAIAAGILGLAMGFISRIASAEGGWGQVPYDGAMTELHKDEMVLPASIATPLRDALGNRESTWSLGATGGGSRQLMDQTTERAQEVVRREGDLHVHLSAMDTQSGSQWLMRNRGTLVRAVKTAHREGTRG